MKEKLLHYLKSPFQIFLLLTFISFNHNQAVAAENNCGEIENIEFTNGDSSQIISDGENYNLGDLPNDFYLNTNVSGNIQSVRYTVKNLETNQQYSIVENYEPYTFPAGNSAWNLGEGTFRIKVRIYKYNYGLGSACDIQNLTITLTNECTADAGTLTADQTSVSLESPGVMISATPNGDINVPTGYSTIYVLTSGDDLVIEQVNADSPSFTVETAGLYTIHTLVYDGNSDSSNFLDLGVVNFGTTTGGDVLGIVGAAGLCVALDVAGAPIMVECTADAGTLTADQTSVSLESPGVMISATPNGDINVPTGYSTIYVLTSGDDLVIEQVNADSPSFTVETAGLYTIHTLVYDGNSDSSNFLDLGVVNFGTTTGGDVLGIVGAAGLCVALDVAGAPIMVECTADAGTLTADQTSVSLESPGVMISATPNGDINVPTGYSTIYVLTSGDDLVIEQVNADSPSFTVETAGLYTIHTLVYDGNSDSSNFLDLGVVNFGTTTGGDVLGIVGAAGLCVALDVAGAPIMVECTADAGTLTADQTSVSLESPGVMISATPNGDINVPTGYSTIYVLTSGDDLVIEQVNADSPSFTVETAGLYTIHTLVYDGNSDSSNFLDLGVVNFGTTTGGDVLGIVGAAGLCVALDVAGAPIMVECTADAGTLTADQTSVSLESPGVMISATPNGDINVPTGYSTIYVLTSGDDLVIEQVNADSPSFTVETAGLYTIHTLVYDGNSDSSNFLDLGVVNFGTTTGGDVLGIVGAAGLCVALDVAGAPIMVECTADAGTLTADQTSVSLESPGVMISATPNGDINVPTGYSTIYVLTSGDDLVIEQVNADSPSFTVETAGLYTIHTLVYDGNSDSSNFLDLGVVNFGTTTGGDVLGIVGAAGLCVALDVAGAPIMVECTADAGTLTADQTSVSLESPGVMISATPNGDINVPTGYSTIYVLTSGDDLVIEQVNADSPSFTVETAGLYTIHTLVYDGNSDSSNFLDLGVVNFGTTTGGDVLGIVGAAGLCVALDVAGAPIMVECTADAGTLTADQTSVSLESPGVMISATPNGDINVPTGYSTIYVLTSGDDLVIEQVNADSPSFTVETAGLYTIHTLVYDGNSDSSNFLDLGVVNFGTTTGGDVLGIVGAAGLCVALDVAGAPIMVECTADAGTLTADQTSVSLESPGVMISATPNGDINVPTGYSTIYVLTSGDDLVIEQVNADSPSFTVETAGLYTIHTLVYDGNSDSSNFLDLGVVNFGTTTGGDVLGIVGAAGLCVALDVAGAPITVDDEACEAYAGTLRSNNLISCLSGGASTISAYENYAPVIPDGYQQLFVLTNAFNLKILEVSASPEFDVDHVGFYRIHSLVYNPETLDLGIVQIGQTTGFDVNGLLQQGGGDICASLDVQGAVFLVLPSWICNWFNFSSYNARGGDPSAEVEGYISQFENYKAFERSILKDNEPRLYPNPVNDILNIDIKLFDDETMSYTISDLGGRLIQSGSVNEITRLGNTIETGRLSSGTYLISFTSDYRNFVKKIQVSK